MSDRVAISRFLDVAGSPGLSDTIDAIFFESSNTKSFENDVARHAFRERWLGRYLREVPQFAYVALVESGEVAGYLVGSLEAEFARDDAFGECAKQFPAHFHINLAPVYRNLGTGRRLVQAFVADAKRNGASGVHVVTRADARNVRFYERNGFVEYGRASQNGATLVFLGRVI
jgi:ribosomal protein S18 acetylase RimI-like enzyme